MYNFCTFTLVIKDMEKKKSIRLEFTKSDKKQIIKAAELDGRSAKNFMEIAVLAATFQTINTYEAKN